MRYLAVMGLMFLGYVGAGCERSPEKPGSAPAKPASSPVEAKDDHDHKPGHGHDDGAADARAHPDGGSAGGHAGEVVELGSAVLGWFHVRASRDKGEVKAGGDAPIDVWIDGGVGQGVTAVRFWIGTQDAKGSIKARAAIEDGKWHTHVEIPSPMPEGSKLWVELEGSDGKKTTGSFDLQV